MKASELLQKARARIEDPARWCTGVYGDDHGKCCAVGALRCEANGSPFVGGRIPEYRFLRRAARELLPDSAYLVVGLSPAAYVNDHIGHAAVLRMFDRAIELAQAEEAVK